MIHYDGIITALQRSGGISVCFEELLSRLVRDGIEFSFDHYAISLAFGARELSPFMVEVAPRRFERYRSSRTIPEAKLFHSTYYRLPRNRKQPTVTTVHDFTYERKLGGLRTLVHSWQKRSSILHADAVICVSEATRTDLLELVPACDPGKVHVVHNGVSDHYYPLDRTGRGGEKPFVLFVGARGGYKNFELAVRIVVRLPGFDLLAAGGGALTPEERLLVGRLLPERFRHVGFVSSEQLNLLYNQAHCLLYPSSYEGFGIPVLEAMRAGCPVVAVGTSSIPEVGGSAALLAPTADEEELLAQIGRLEEEAERAHRIADGIEWSAQFSWEATYRNTLRVYRSIVDI